MSRRFAGSNACRQRFGFCRPWRDWWRRRFGRRRAGFPSGGCFGGGASLTEAAHLEEVEAGLFAFGGFGRQLGNGGSGRSGDFWDCGRGLLAQALLRQSGS